jgi:putative sterol carrier protein
LIYRGKGLNLDLVYPFNYQILIEMPNPAFLQKMSERFNKAAAENLYATYLFQVEGEGDYSLKIQDQDFQITEGAGSNPNVTLKANKETWEEIVSGKTPAQMAFMMGRLNVTGDFPLALKLASLFALN